MAKTFNLIENKIAFKGFFQLNQITLTHSLFAGGHSNNLQREVFKRNPAVVVFLYDLKHKNIVLVEQFRAGAAQNALAKNNVAHAWLLEPVAGMVDSGEEPIAAAIRETKEETGLEISELEYISEFYPSPGACDEMLHLYAAQIDSTKVSSHAGLADENEDIKVVVMPFAEAYKMLTQAEFNVASTFIAIQWLFMQKLKTIECS